VDTYERERLLWQLYLVVDTSSSLALDSAEDRKELKRRLDVAVHLTEFKPKANTQYESKMNVQHPNYFAIAPCGGNMCAPESDHRWIEVGTNVVCSHCDVLKNSLP
jgi:hypothetical protein